MRFDCSNRQDRIESYTRANQRLQPTALVQIKFEDNKLWILSLDGKSWDALCAETEARFFVKEDETYRFEFIRDTSGNVTALRLEIQGIPLPVSPKMLSE